MDNILNSLSNNVNGLKSSKKRNKMFEYFREKNSNNGIIFLQETHSSEDAVNNCEMTSRERSFFHMVQQVLAES